MNPAMAVSAFGRCSRSSPRSRSAHRRGRGEDDRRGHAEGALGQDVPGRPEARAAYGLLKIAVIVQQIYFRYRQGLTKDPRFAQLDKLVKACGVMAQKAIEKRRVDRLG